MVEISGGTYEKMEAMQTVKDSTRQREAFFLEFAQKARAAEKKANNRANEIIYTFLLFLVACLVVVLFCSFTWFSLFCSLCGYLIFIFYMFAASFLFIHMGQEYAAVLQIYVDLRALALHIPPIHGFWPHWFLTIWAYPHYPLCGNFWSGEWR